MEFLRFNFSNISTPTSSDPLALFLYVNLLTLYLFLTCVLSYYEFSTFVSIIL